VPHQDGAGVIEAVGGAVPPERINQRVWLWNAQAGRPLGTGAAGAARSAQSKRRHAGRAGGCLPAADGFLSELRQRCDRHGSMLIFDEVMTSRMSSGGAQQRLGIRPDLTTLGKYLAGGMTFGAFGGPAVTMAVFDPERGGTLSHGGTFNNNAVSMAAGVATLSEILTPAVLDAHFDRGESMRARWSAIADASPLPLTITGWGSMFALHTTDGPVRSPADTARTDPVLSELIFHELLDRGVYLAPRGFAALSLAIGEDEIERATAAFADALEDTAASTP
jgi:glutamate-1-semialdehyde 2,1-aminomutase